MNFLSTSLRTPNAVSATSVIALWLGALALHGYVLGTHWNAAQGWLNVAWYLGTVVLPLSPIFFFVSAAAQLRMTPSAFQSNIGNYRGKAPAPVDRGPWVTVQVPVFTEDFQTVIQKTLETALVARETYRGRNGRMNIVVFDDALQYLALRILLQTGSVQTGLSNAQWTEIFKKISLKSERLQPLSADEEEIWRRVSFYRAHQIGFIARPINPRAGAFPKGSNLNYGLQTEIQAEQLLLHARLIQQLRSEISERYDSEAEYRVSALNAFKENTSKHGNLLIAEGDIGWGQISCSLDKDSWIPADATARVMGLFAEDPKLAYVQMLSFPYNPNETSFSSYSSQMTKDLFRLSVSGGAMAGDSPLHAGHNVYMRREALEAAARTSKDGKQWYWDEDQATEDLAFMMRVRAAGWRGLFLGDPETMFHEKASRVYSEEASRFRRFGFGAFNVLFNPINQWTKKGVFHPVWLNYWRSKDVFWHQKVNVFVVYITPYLSGAITYLLTIFQIWAVATGIYLPYTARYALISTAVNVVILNVVNPASSLKVLSKLSRVTSYKDVVKPVREEFRRLLKSNFQGFIFFNSLQGRWASGLFRHLMDIPTRFGATGADQLTSMSAKKIFKQTFKENNWSMVFAAINIVGLIYDLIIMKPDPDIHWRGFIYWAIFGPAYLMFVGHIVAPFVLNPLFMSKLHPRNLRSTVWLKSGVAA